MLMKLTRRTRPLVREDAGFTMIFAIMVLLISGLLVVGAFTAVDQDIHLTNTNTAEDKAYDAALAGLQVYLSNLNTNSNYWNECPHTPESGSEKTPVKVPGTTDETYTYETVGSSRAVGEKCVSSEPASVIESASVTANGTFRVKAVGEAPTGESATGKTNFAKRTVVATFSHPGFLNYVFFSNFEVEDPSTTGANQEHCENYYEERKTKGYLTECPAIPWVPEDEVNGPFHTNDAAAICAEGTKEPSFGSIKSDLVEFRQKTYAWTIQGTCKDKPLIKGKEVTGGVAKLTPPESSEELLKAAEDKFVGRTVIELEGNKMRVVNAAHPESEVIPFPPGGVVYVENKNTAKCPKYSPFTNNEDYENDAECGDVYVKGKYNESLTIGAADNVIIVGNLYEETTNDESREPTGAGVLGLIATEFVRVFHPVKCTINCKNERFANQVTGTCNATNEVKGEGPPANFGFSYYGTTSGWGSLKNPIIDAAILSTAHSWIVDNFFCGAELEKLNVWGAIAEDWRGRVTSTLTNTNGYVKNYNYDRRMATSQPPSFLSPTVTGGWKIGRETE